ncbi:PucR family transcriptional regulator [Cryobacterium sp. TMT1-21]|uniref:PucR family transcriptional regulator n=1 Tax=Cryobacterium shii TaxID=1259235 RepID=A0AAQ2C300_9MICO|nr:MULTISPECIES: PucR family transcriptional regulator [Cryobacterium]TFC40960.1 PucR family transcriptional regulator [Cryobacterium shii]TFC87807.1 PucR family transcriptional regulator [Cryobacterium sp. TmT2-59]TFD12437.1 PucR family transcriptional regulator [Cryobacterium sp. TMT1-21]TFD19377.1 PucR family transcriptional regulator [Cryobacterium sp. TMT2-23]TFD19879.1 PucR family transcriptional regulator [Cryobacterium sp. TMT4-10]
MNSAEIEDLVEALAAALDRALSLEDLDGGLLAYSRDQPLADSVRVNFLLSKKVPADVSAWQLHHGIATAVRPVVVPANVSLGMLGRVCVPLMVRGFRVGYLWAMQGSHDESPAEILGALPAVRGQLDRLAETLLDTKTAESEHRRQREALFLAACDADTAAIEELAGWPQVHAAGPWHLATLLPRPDEPATARDGTAVDPAAAVLLQRISALQATVGIDAARFSAGTETHTVVLLRDSPGRVVHTEILHRYRAELARRGGRAQRPDLLGFSEAFHDLRRFPDAYVQSRKAVQAAAVDARLGTIADFRQIGVYQFLAASSRNLSPVESVYFAELRDFDANHELLPMLELLYDTDGSVQDVAATLHLHRSSIYNRLAKIRTLIGVDPLGGQVRLELHLAMKAARWSRRPRI